MTREVFLNSLREKLKGLSPEDIEDRISFYYEMIDDIMDAKQRYINSYFVSRSPKSEDPLFDTKIIVDGGISNFDDIQKCLALGAFAVMNGSCFAKSEEACGEVRYVIPDENGNIDFEHGIQKSYYDEIYNEYLAHGAYCGELTTTDKIFIAESEPYREYYGMSHKRAQKEYGNKSMKTSEGIVRPVKVEYPIAKWADNMKSFLASAMSYTDCKTIDEFRENTEVIINLSGDKSYRK